MGGRSASSVEKNDETDAELALRAFQLMQIHDVRLVRE